MMFLDTSFAIAITLASDAAHERAAELSQQLKARGTRVVTTNVILMEIGDALSRQRYRRYVLPLLNHLRGDPTIEIVNLSAELFERAIKLYSQRPDKEWGLTDCVSFVVMQERGIMDALTADEHFQQAGFRAMLRESE